MTKIQEQRVEPIFGRSFYITHKSHGNADVRVIDLDTHAPNDLVLFE